MIRGPLRLAVFRRLLAVYTADQIIDWIASIALMILVYDRTSSALATAALLLCKTFAPALLVPLLAARTDRVGVRAVVAASLALAAGALAVLAVGPPGALWPATLLLGTAAMLGRSTIRATVPLTLEPEDLKLGNGALNVASAALTAAGPLAGAAAVVALGAESTLLLACAIAAAAAVIAAVTFPDIQADHDPDEPGEAVTAPTNMVWVLLAGAAALILLFSMDEPALVAYTRESLNAGDVTYGVLVGAWGVGLLIGSAAYFRLRHVPSVALVTRSAVVIAVGYLTVGLAPTTAIATVACVVCGAGNGTMQVALITAVQEAVPAQLQVRAAAWIEAIGAAAAGLGYLAGGALAAGISPRAPFVVGGLLAVAVTTAMLVALVTGARPRAAR